jgi:D-alanine-D-alanine ligase
MGNSTRGEGGVNAKPLHIAVLMGGWSSEREVSLVSGAGVADALESLGHKVTRIDMGRDVAQRIAEAAPDVVFNALHGTPGEDGSVQGMLDLMGIKYTHSGMATSVIAIDKQLTKHELVPHGIPMPEGVIVDSESLYAGDPIPRPYVLKPVNEGSSVGVAIITEEGNYGLPIARESEGPWKHFEHLLAEPFIPGRELTVAVLGEEALAVTELKPKSGFYDYDAKYTDGLTVHICPADIPDDVEEEARTIALKAHRLLGCKGTSRSDFRWDETRDLAGLFLLEVNTQPGMTPLSLVPEQGRFKGLSYAELVQRIVDEALQEEAA